ncbi:hypothetical protein TrRE_jg12628, partial [Triparma retinervis]
SGGEKLLDSAGYNAKVEAVSKLSSLKALMSEPWCGLDGETWEQWVGAMGEDGTEGTKEERVLNTVGGKLKGWVKDDIVERMRL